MNKKWNLEKFKNIVKEKSNSQYEILSETFGTIKDKYKIKHLKCGTEYEVLGSNFLRGIGGCPKCAIEKRKKKMTKTNEEFKNEIYLLVGNEYSVASKYISSNKKISFYHDKCNKTFNMTPSNFLQGQRCPYCNSSESKRKTLDEVQNRIHEKLDTSYNLISGYKNNHTKISILHKKCNNVWNTTLRDINAGNRCPFCTTISKGEEKIINYLKKNNIDFIYQYKNELCKNKQVLPFDFKLINEDILIEYDGIQHFEPIYGDVALKKQQLNDSIKNDFVKNNNLKLVRIKYTDFENIETILKKELTKI